MSRPFHNYSRHQPLHLVPPLKWDYLLGPPKTTLSNCLDFSYLQIAYRYCHHRSTQRKIQPFQMMEHQIALSGSPIDRLDILRQLQSDRTDQSFSATPSLELIDHCPLLDLSTALDRCRNHCMRPLRNFIRAFHRHIPPGIHFATNIIHGF